MIREIFLYHKDFCIKYNLNGLIREYNKAMKAIPAPVKSMTQQLVLNANMLASLCM